MAFVQKQPLAKMRNIFTAFTGYKPFYANNIVPKLNILLIFFSFVDDFPFLHARCIVSVVMVIFYPITQQPISINENKTKKINFYFVHKWIFNCFQAVAWSQGSFHSIQMRLFVYSSMRR